METQKQSATLQEYLHYDQKYSKLYGPNTCILYRLGDFYELYENFNVLDEASKLSKISEITNMVKTRKNKSKPPAVSNPYMMGLPYLSLNRYVQMLVDNNYTCVIIDQLTTPPNVKRGLTHIYSPGTFTNPDQISSNYITSIYIINESQQTKSPLKSIGMCSIDVSTGSCSVFEIQSQINDPQIALDECYRFLLTYPTKEVLLIGDTNDSVISHLEIENKKIHKMTTVDKAFEKLSYQNDYFRKIYKPNSLLSPIEDLNMEHMPNSRLAMLTLFNFIHKHNESFLNNINRPEIFLNGNHLILYNDAIQQLNILENGQSSGNPNIKIKCLLDVVNHCVTAIGKRYIKDQLCNPLTDPNEINLRYNCAEELINGQFNIDQFLRFIMDISKLSRRITFKSISPNDLVLLVESCEVVEKLYDIIKTTQFNIKYIPDEEIIKQTNDFINTCKKTLDFDEMRKYNTISDIEDTLFLKDIYVDIDKLHQNLKNDGLSMMEVGNALAKQIDDIVGDGEETTKNKKTTKIELKKNKKLGHYLQLSKAKSVILKEKLSAMKEIVISESLKINVSSLEFDESVKTTSKIYFKDINVNSKNTNALHEKLKMMVKRKYAELLVEYNNTFSNMFKKISTFIAKIDFNSSNAKTARMYNYCKPTLVENNTAFVQFKSMRNPIVERLNEDIEYKCHDISLGKYGDNETDLMILFGLNYAGKSTIIRGVGNNIILAQCGMYVAASNMVYSPYESLFARVSNTDNAFKKQSTFTKELDELWKIIERSREGKSILISDEPCSGTEHVSALSIVSVTIITLNNKHVSGIIATHFHELAKMERITTLSNTKMFHLTVQYDKEKDILIFDRILKEGSGPSNYGLDVMRYIIKDSDFVRLAYEIKNQILDENNDILSTKASHFNKNLYVTSCQVCGKRNTQKKYESILDVHHINFQCNATPELYVIGKNIPLHAKSNLVCLCKSCHNAVHKPKPTLIINGYLETSSGRILDFQLL
jgi:DNA mismatch repair protein MutS